MLRRAGTTIPALCRGKRTGGRPGVVGDSNLPETGRALYVLKMLSARRKIPKMLNFSNEDVVRHMTITTAFKQHQKEKRQAWQQQMEQQYNAVRATMDDLRAVLPYHFHEANVNLKGKRVDLELRVPTDYPPTEVWHAGWKAEEPETKA